MIDIKYDYPESKEHPGCFCPTGDYDACIAGRVYVPCVSDSCGGVCEMAGDCDCPKHASPTHDSGYGGTYAE